MGTTFDRRFKRSAMHSLLREFGEDVVYHKRSGGSRTITMIVEREPPTVFDAGGQVVLPMAICRVKNDCESGILGSELDTGGDEIEFPRRIGDIMPGRYSVGQIVSQGGGVLRFSVM